MVRLFFLSHLFIFLFAIPCLGQDNSEVETAKMISYVYGTLSDRHMNINTKSYNNVDSLYSVVVIDTVGQSRILEITSLSDPLHSTKKRIIINNKLTLLFGFKNKISDIKINSNINIPLNLYRGPKIASALLDFEYEPNKYTCDEEGQALACTSERKCVEFKPIGDSDTWFTQKCE